MKLVPALTAVMCCSIVTSPALAAKRMIVLGVDGMDPVFLSEMMAAGEVPNLARMAETGGFKPLGTSIPPQSPVAWSNFITGMNPGGHGIFDFVALDRNTLAPYLSAARVQPSRMPTLSLGKWRVPLGSEATMLLRDGQAFWEVLDAADIPATVFRVPVNYPPIPYGRESLSGMGTPDLLGTPGTFSLYTTAAQRDIEELSGGVVHRVKVANGRFSAVVLGPGNAFIDGAPASKATFDVHIDADKQLALVEFSGSRALLNTGDWSDWLEVSFDLVPGLVSVPGMVRLYLKSVSPEVELYMSPVNIDPRNPAQKISVPDDYATDLAAAAGPFYTQEMPEDTKALSAGVISPEEFIEQSDLVLGERFRLFRHELQRFADNAGDRFMFFYLSSVDQRNHMLAREQDPLHPFHREDTPLELREAMRHVYREVDALVGWALQNVDEETVFVVMSDHGFAPFRRQANLNSWLEQQGYLAVKDPGRRDSADWLQNIDWSRTRAFGIGLNSLYINVRGRERSGIVEPIKRQALAREIATKLAAWQDPENGAFVVTQPLLREDAYSGEHIDAAPDIIVGYGRGYRASWATSTGKIPSVLLEDNDRAWSGDHCMDSREVPGVLLSTNPLGNGELDLRDLPGSILRFFAVEPPTQMQHRNAF